MISVEDFADECRGWLSANYPQREAIERASFVWGHGSDDVSLFEEVDHDAGVDVVAAARAWRAALAHAGLAWITGPQEYGGRALSRDHQGAFDAAARNFEVPGNALLMVSLGMVAPTILDHGSEDAKTRYLRALHDGSLIACQLFSEPGAGSDLGSASTRAVSDGDGWRVTGQKVWTSGAHFSDVGEVLCRTGDGPGRDCFTMFMVDMRAPGVDIRPLRQMTGGAAFNEVFLDDVWIPDSDRLGVVDDGWRVMLTTLSHERRSIGGQGFGGVGLLSAQRYIDMARVLGRSDDPIVRQHLAGLICHLRVGKYNSKRGMSFGKLELSRNYQRITALVGELLGPALVADADTWGTYAWSGFVLGVPGMRIGGGTDEILLNALAERRLGLPREPRPSS